MSNHQEAKETKQSQAIVGNGKKKNKTTAKRSTWILIGFAITIVIVAVGAWQFKKNSSEPNPQLRGILGEDATTEQANANLLGFAVESYKVGGTINGTTITSHGYYPSAVDLKNKQWTKENLNLDYATNEAIAYEPKNCSTDKPSSSENKCTGFVIKVNDEIIVER